MLLPCLDGQLNVPEPASIVTELVSVVNN